MRCKQGQGDWCNTGCDGCGGCKGGDVLFGGAVGIGGVGGGVMICNVVGCGVM